MGQRGAYRIRLPPAYANLGRLFTTCKKYFRRGRVGAGVGAGLRLLKGVKREVETEVGVAENSEEWS